MTREKLIEQLEDILMLESGGLALDKNLDEYEDWDSLAHLSLIALFDRSLNIRLDSKQIGDFVKPQDILDRAGL